MLRPPEFREDMVTRGREEGGENEEFKMHVGEHLH